MKKWGFLIMGLLLVGLVVGMTVPAVMASRSADSGEDTSLTAAAEAELAGVAADLEEADSGETKEIKLLEVTLGGGFQGVWGTDNAEQADSTGNLVGIYGRVKRAGCGEADYFKGIWLTDNGSVFGWLKGKCSDNGTFSGVWRNPETGAGGSVKGTYSSSDSDNVTAGEFNGTWESRDGEQSGYLRGTWSPVVSAEREGRFGGRWINDNQVSALCKGSEVSAKCKAKCNEECSTKCDQTGRIWGCYGEIKLADGTSIEYFRGKWHAANNSAHGQLAGLAIDGKFYGVWGCHGKLCRAGGYLTGDYSYNSQLDKEPKGTFEGVWGRFGQEGSGQLKGKFGPLSVSAPFEDQEF